MQFVLVSIKSQNEEQEAAVAVVVVSGKPKRGRVNEAVRLVQYYSTIQVDGSR